MSLFGSFMSKKPVSPRPNAVEEKEDGGDTLLNAEVGETTRKRTKTKSKKNKKESETSAASLAIAAEAEESLSSSEDEGLAAKGEKEVEEEVEVEHVDEDLKPFDTDTSLLVFHTGQVYVREDREVVVEKGGHAVIRDLPSSIHPASLNFSSHSDAEASIIEHTFENGTDSFASLLAESIGETVALWLSHKGDGSVKGKLLRATDAEVVLETDEGSVEAVSRAHIVSAEVNHQSFNREPALHCVVETQQEGAHKAQLTYEASGITWSAEYTLVVRPDSEAEFTGWFTLENNSGKTFTNAALALVAAPHTAPASYDYERSNKKPKNIVSSLSSFSKRKSAKPKVPTQDISYLPRPVTLVQGKDKQVRITHATFPIEQINLFRKFFGPYSGGFMGAHSDHNLEGREAINKVLRWTNSKTTHPRLGVELAAGSIDVLDSVKGDTFLNLRHQDQLKFARPGKEILLVTGGHPDLHGERKVTELRADAKTRTIRETVQIEIKNTGSAKQEVVVEDLLWRWHSYTVSPCQPKYDDIAKGKQIMTWRVLVPARSAETVRYTVLYSNVPLQ